MYAILFLAVCFVVFVAVPACDRWEKKRSRDDREWFANHFGGGYGGQR